MQQEVPLSSLMYQAVEELAFEPFLQVLHFLTTAIDDVVEDVISVGGTIILSCGGYSVFVVSGVPPSKKVMLSIIFSSHVVMSHYADHVSNYFHREAVGLADRWLVTRLVSDAVEDSVKFVWYVWKFKWPMVDYYFGVSSMLLNRYFWPDQTYASHLRVWGKIGLVLFNHGGTVMVFIQDYNWINAYSDRLGDSVSRCLLFTFTDDNEKQTKTGNSAK